MDTRVFKHVDGLDLRADVYPAITDGRPGPVLLLLHSGTLIAGGRSWFAQYQLDAYRAAGYTVVAIDYRLAPHTKAPDIASDVVDAADWIRDDLCRAYRVDPQRLGLVGQSAGGYLALLCGQRIDPRPRAVVSFYGYGDIIGRWYAQPDPHYCALEPVTRRRALAAVGSGPIADGSLHPERLDFYVHCRQTGTWLEEVFGHPRGAGLEALEPYCPERTVRPEDPPTLLLHGDRDTDVPYEKSQSMARALESRGVECELVTVPGAGHTFDLPARYQFRTGRGASMLRRAVGLLSPVLPRTTLRGAAPPGGDGYLRSVIRFLDRHLA